MNVVDDVSYYVENATLKEKRIKEYKYSSNDNWLGKITVKDIVIFGGIIEFILLFAIVMVLIYF